MKHQQKQVDVNAIHVPAKCIPVQMDADAVHNQGSPQKRGAILFF